MTFRVWRMRDEKRQQFRWAPHTSGHTPIKPKDFEDAGAREAASLYALWSELQPTGEALRIGDVLESANGELRIYKYVGFEPASWVLPEVKTGIEMAPPAAGGELASAASA